MPMPGGAFGLAPRRRPRRRVRRAVVARHDAHVHDAHLARLHFLDALLYRGAKLRKFSDGPDAHSTLRTRHHREVDVGLVDALPDPLVLDRAAAGLRHPLLVQLVVVAVSYTH